MAGAQLFCPQCGTARPPGAPVCVKCGTPFAVAARQPAGARGSTRAQPERPPPLPVAPPAASPAASHQYPLSSSYRPALGSKLGHARLFVLLGGALGLGCILVVIAVYLFTPHGPPPCRFNCGPEIGTRLPEAATYRSDAFGFEVDYPSDWNVDQRSGTGIDLATYKGELKIRSDKAGKSLDQLIQDALAELPSASWQGVTPLHSIAGSHIGFQAGKGTEFAANLAPAAGQTQPMRVVILAATHGNLSVVVIAWNPYQPPKNERNQSGMPESGIFDYVLAEFRWPGA